MHEKSCVRISDLEKELDKAGYEAKAKDEMIEDLKESLRYGIEIGKYIKQENLEEKKM